MTLAAGANVLLPALIGGRAAAVLNHPLVDEVLTTAATHAEVQEYALPLARKERLGTHLVLLAASTLPVTVVARDVYVDSVPEARRLIGRRDPDDVEILALAIHFSIPVWSNGNDFDGLGILWYTTAGLLARLERQ